MVEGAGPIGLSTSTDPLSTPLTLSQAKHLHARLTFGAGPDQVNASEGRLALDVVNELLDAAELDLETAPEWADVLLPPRNASDEDQQQFSDDNAAWRQVLRDDLVREMTVNGLRGKLFLFWHNHFVTSMETYRYAALGYRYARTLRQSSLGDFRQLVKEITADGAMLVYLDGRNNSSSAPNENYARELMELFTMGPTSRDGSVNYTEADVQEMARAMTGYTLTGASSWESNFVGARHDSGVKTLFGSSGSWTPEEAIDHLFAERGEEVAEFVAAKAYRAFIHHVEDPTFIEALASEFLNADYSLRVLFQTLFASERFFDPGITGGVVKSPLDLYVTHYGETGQAPNDAQIRQIWLFARQTEQLLLNPPNVAGWPGHRDWLDTNTLGSRWNYSSLIARRRMTDDQIRSFAEEVSDPVSAENAFELPLALARHLTHIPMDWVEIPLIEGGYEGDLDAFPIPDWVLSSSDGDQSLIKLFLGSTPWYEWDLSSDNAPGRIASYLDRLVQLPEYQLI